ncbi:MAG: N-formylglutamate amidohydrolase [Bacilli bacterium]|nr:N-formylglutamate amidohydrolase [Bacilli bacterium]MDD4608203.1 N-formylglutamate amidohydrolase [Bacilli bacterium]
MSFEDIINNYESNVSRYQYMIKEGKVPVMLTAVHTVQQEKESGLKLSEPYTSAICQYVGNMVNSSFMIKSIDNGVDSNSREIDDFKQLLKKKIQEKEIKLLIDIHGASDRHDFDVEFGTLKNMTIDINTQNTLKDCFNNHDIVNINYNMPFCGGGITRYIYENTDIDIIQLEINRKYRDFNNIDNCKKICDALIDFIKIYTNYH